MNTFEENLLVALDRAPTEREAFDELYFAARKLGFDHVAYGLRLAIPVSNPKVITMNSYAENWQKRYAANGYMFIDPTVKHAHQSSNPVIWTDRLFAATPDFWEDAQSHGLRVGWAQSSFDGFGVGGMLTISRSNEKLTAVELEAKERQLRWLVQAAHIALSRLMQKKHVLQLDEGLTPREVEVLKWTADGKTSMEIGDIMNTSMHTVNFHLRNAVKKLKAENKTAAVVQALMRGLLH